MTPAGLLGTVIRPTLAWMGARYVSPEAELALLAIQRVEDEACTRCQVGGPARGLWQFEPGGVSGVRLHIRTVLEADRALSNLGIGGRSLGQVCALMEHDDRLACVFARLLLWTDPAPLPPVPEQGTHPLAFARQQQATWDLYLRLWRPGKPRPGDWPWSYRSALAAVWAAPDLAS